jgi:hypothetical protein
VAHAAEYVEIVIFRESTVGVVDDVVEFQALVGRTVVAAFSASMAIAFQNGSTKCSVRNPSTWIRRGLRRWYSWRLHRAVAGHLVSSMRFDQPRTRQGLVDVAHGAAPRTLPVGRHSGERTWWL